MLFDTHAHLDDEQFDQDRDQVVQRAIVAGVTSLVAVGTTAESSRKSVQLAEQYECVFASVGIQPNYCASATGDDWNEIVELAGHPRVVALGETGLDRYWDYTPLDVQRDFFDRHICLSQQTNLPFIVHMRDCLPDILQMLEEAHQRGPLRGVMHSYTGDEGGAAQCVELGLFISFAGMVTFKKSDELRQVAATVPSDRILIETDAPYLSPHPCRSKRPNEPALIEHTARCLAEVRGVSFEEFARQTSENARVLFG